MSFKNSKFKCSQDPNTKELVCRSFAENKDGTRVELASLKARVDGECTPVVSDFDEHYPGEFEKLESKVINRLVGKCKKTNIPDDF